MSWRRYPELLQDRHVSLAKETVAPAPKGKESGFSGLVHAETDGHCTPGLWAAPKTSQLSELWNLETPIRS